MATMQFTVWVDAKEVALGEVAQEDTVAIGATSAQSAAITGSNKAHRRVRVICDMNAWVNWGSNPTAAVDGENGRMMGAENPEYFGMVAGDIIAVIAR